MFKHLAVMIITLAAAQHTVASPANGKQIIFKGNDKINVIADPKANGGGVRDNPFACVKSALACAPVVVTPPNGGGGNNAGGNQGGGNGGGVVNPPVVPPTQNPLVKIIEARKALEGVCVKDWGRCAEKPLEPNRRPPVIDEIIEYVPAE